MWPLGVHIAHSLALVDHRRDTTLAFLSGARFEKAALAQSVGLAPSANSTDDLASSPRAEHPARHQRHHAPETTAKDCGVAALIL